MSTITCPSCGTDTPADYNFCIACDKQIKCLNADCNKLLVRGKTFCFHCGQTLAAVESSQAPLNNYVRKVKQRGKDYEEHTEFNVSNEAVRDLAPFIVRQAILENPQRPYSPNFGDAIVKDATKQLDSTTTVEAEAFQQLPALEAPKETEPPQPETAKNEAARCFIKDGDFLVATQKDFKGKNWADQQRHFILLYASAYPEFFESFVPSKAHFKTAAEKASIIDPSNFSKYLTALAKRELSETSNGFVVNDDGKVAVKKILSLMADDNVDAGHRYWEHSASPTTKKYRTSKADKDKVKEWAQDEVQIGNIEVRNIEKPRDYAMVSLWIITVHLHKAEAVRWNDAYYYFQEKFKTISASSESFSRAMASPSHSKYFRKSGDLYFLTSEGQAKVEGWIAGNPFDSTIDDNGSD